MEEKILIIGAGGQIGTELANTLGKTFGIDNVIATDLQKKKHFEGIFEQLDVLDKNAISGIVKKYKITQLYNLAALLSATGEKNPKLAWKLNMEGLINGLDVALENGIKKVFWPSSIAVFGTTTPKQNTPQFTTMEPTTVYGISKLAGERWCEYYFNKYQLDVRSIRYPGLISHQSAPGGGTTDYAVEIFYEAIKNNSYNCFLNENTRLPMMYMDDAIRATIELMESPIEKIKIRSSYNLSSINFTPKEIADEIKLLIPDFSISYKPDFRQEIADSWPESIDDTNAKNDWGWQPKFDLQKMTMDMLINLQKKMLV